MSRFAGLAALFALGACAAPIQRVYAPSPGGSLPLLAAKPASQDPYAWLDRADALLDAIADAPPDYTFDFEGRSLFAWDVDGVLIVEEAGSEGYVLYLYDTGQDWPFFIRTPDEAAGFDGQELNVVYTRDGDVLVDADRLGSNPRFRPLQLRALDLRRAAARNRWDRSAAQAWVGAESFIIETRDAWDAGWRADRDRAEYRRRIEADAARAALESERRRRREARDEFRRWRESGSAGAPPPGVRRPDRRGDRFDRPGDRDDRPIRPDRDDRPDRRRDRDDRPNRPDRDGRPDGPREGDSRPDRPGREDRPGRPDGSGPNRPAPIAEPAADRPVERPAPPRVREPSTGPRTPVSVPEADPEPPPGQVAPDRLTRPRQPPTEQPIPPTSGRDVIPVNELLRDEEERRRADAAALERATREQEQAARAMREAQAEEARMRREQDERDAAEAVRRTEAAEAERRRAEAAAIARAEQESAAINEAARRQEEAEAEAQVRVRAEAERRAAEQAAAEEAARREREAQAEARRQAAERAAAEEARRRAEQEEEEARSREQERRRNVMEPTLEPQ